MLKVVWNIVKYVVSLVFSILRPLRRLICQRRKSSESDGTELTSIGTGSLMLDTPLVYPGDGDAEIELESWEAWDVQAHSGSSHPPDQSLGLAASYGHRDALSGSYGGKVPQGFPSNKREPPPVDPEPEVNFFQDMTPEVKRQPKILIRKKDTGANSSTVFTTNRLAVMSDVPISPNSELEAWQDEVNAWETEAASDDLLWQAEEAIKENRRKERIERHLEQQKKKQRKDETRGVRGGSIVATKLS